MIKEIYIDNYRSLVNFRIQPGQFQLWLGDNGSGKSTVLDVLECIQRVMAGGSVEDIFSSDSLTIWTTKREQEFGVTLEIDGDSYEYRLVVEFADRAQMCRIKREELLWRGDTFYHFDGKEAHLYRINRESGGVEEGTSFAADWSRSVIPGVGERDDNQPLHRFRRDVGRWLLVMPLPPIVEQSARKGASHLSRRAENFAAWYMHVKQEEDMVAFSAYEHLKEILPGFVSLNLKESGEARTLKATFLVNGEERTFDFMRISDGQRQLIMLYMIAEALRRGLFSSLFIDEADHFLALREVSPFVSLLDDVTDDLPRQAILISHHPETVNLMGHEGELWFSRRDGTHTTTDPYPTTPGLTPAETMARGWEHE